MKIETRETNSCADALFAHADSTLECLTTVNSLTLIAEVGYVGLGRSLDGKLWRSSADGGTSLTWLIPGGGQVSGGDSMIVNEC